MQWIVATVCLILFINIVLTETQGDAEKKEALKRPTEKALCSLFDNSIKEIEQKIIETCNKHKALSDIQQKDLTDTMGNVKACMKKYPIYVTPKLLLRMNI